MQTADVAQFLVAYLHVSRASVASSIQALRAFHCAQDAADCRVACLQREAQLYSNQFVVFIAARDPARLIQCSSSHDFSSLLAAIDAVRIAPTIIKKFRSVVPVDFSSSRAREMLQHFTAAAPATFSVTHLDVIPSIPGNVDRALALIAKEAEGVQQQQQQQQQHDICGGCIYFFVMQQTDRSNHFTVVQGWTSAQHKVQYDEGAAMAFKEQFYYMGPLVGGCVWDEQFHASVI